MKRIKGFIHTIPAILAVLVLITSLLVGGGVGGAYASASANGEYTDVLDDLHKDETFDMREYPAVDNDYSLDVFQIAESTSGELFIYVYQPSANVKPLTATTVGISQSIGENLSPQDFKLKLLNSDTVFQKYLVEGLVVKSDVVRYYDIIAIHRLWDKDIDEPTGNDNEISAIAYEVAKLYTACTVNGNVSYTREWVDVITVTSKYVAKLRYLNGFNLSSYSQCDAWYVAFSTDINMEKLLEADVTYISRSVSTLVTAGKVTDNYGKYEDNFIPLKVEDLVSNPEYGLFGDKHSWKRIESVDEFKNKETLNSVALTNLADKQWVLRFTETEYKATVGSYASTYYSTEVSDVSILRLKYKISEDTYNVGVVDNFQTGSEISNGEKGLWEIFVDFCKWLESLTGVSYVMWIIIFFAIPVCMIFSILSIFFPVVRSALKVVFKGIGYGIYYLAYAIWLIISLPFRGIALFIEWIKDKKDGG